MDIQQHPFDCGHMLIGGFDREFTKFTPKDYLPNLEKKLTNYINKTKDKAGITQISCTLLSKQQPIRDILRKLGFKKTPDRIHNKYSKEVTICIYYWENPYYFKDK